MCVCRTRPGVHRVSTSHLSDASASALGRPLLPDDHHARRGHPGKSAGRAGLPIRPFSEQNGHCGKGI